MKQLKNFTLKFVGVIIAAIAFMFGFASCNDDTTTDSTSFALYYTSMTDISPTMTGTIASPTYKGAEPSGFSITGVTFGDDNQPYTGDSFSIDETTGAVTFSNTSELQIGKYKISVSCIAGGKSYHFKDAIVVNFMKAVPDGITVEPAELLVEYADIINTEDQTIVLPTAQVKTDGDHISISGYEISGIKKGNKVIENFPDPLFAISSTGEISIVKGNQSIEIGTYVLSLKLNTAVAGSDSEMGLFADAVKINVISKPLDLTYEPNSGKLEEVTTEPTSFRSQIPLLKGSLEGVNYSIENVTPEDGMGKITIDSKTGEIIVPEGHGFTKGNSYKISVRVKNQFCEEGVVFNDRFTLSIVDYITPISGLNYTISTNPKQAVAFTLSKDQGFTGSDPIFEFVDLAPEYVDQLYIDPSTGDISAPADNNLPLGTHYIKVRARNDKNEQTTDINLVIDTNPSYFTFISYGTNLVGSSTPGDIYDNQYRFRKKDKDKFMTLKPKIVGNESTNIKWTLETKTKSDPAVTLEQSTGEITLDLSKVNWDALDKTDKFSIDELRGMTCIFVTAEINEDSYSYSRTIPVFINYSMAFDKNKFDATKDNKKNGLSDNQESGIYIEYTPMVLRVNPKTGGRSVVPQIEGDAGDCLIDYRRSFFYYNIKGVDSNNQPFKEGTLSGKDDSKCDFFLGHLWKKVSIPTVTNYGSKDAVSYYYNNKPKTSEQLNKNALAYVDNSATQNRYSVYVNPLLWNDDGWADGVFVGQMTFTIDGTPASLGYSNFRIFPFAIWFDKDYYLKNN